jgi:hypothetical protein
VAKTTNDTPNCRPLTVIIEANGSKIDGSTIQKPHTRLKIYIAQKSSPLDYTTSPVTFRVINKSVNSSNILCVKTDPLAHKTNQLFDHLSIPYYIQTNSDFESPLRIVNVRYFPINSKSIPVWGITFALITGSYKLIRSTESYIHESENSNIYVRLFGASIGVIIMATAGLRNGLLIVFFVMNIIKIGQILNLTDIKTTKSSSILLKIYTLCSRLFQSILRSTVVSFNWIKSIIEPVPYSNKILRIAMGLILGTLSAYFGVLVARFELFTTVLPIISDWTTLLLFTYVVLQLVESSNRITR